MKSEDLNEEFSFLDDSLPLDNVLQLHDRIETLQHQNKTSIQQLCELECEEEKKSRMLIECERKMKKCQNENEELKKELKVKKKFAFKT